MVRITKLIWTTDIRSLKLSSLHEIDDKNKLIPKEDRMTERLQFYMYEKI